jgi:hypothetical protein
MTIFINGTTGISGVDGSAGTPALQGNDTNTGISFGSDVIIGSTGGVERFRVDSAGRLGVGTATPSESLHVSGGRGRFASGTNFLDAYHNGTTAYLETTGGASTALGFATAGSERGRFDTSGRFLVGTSSAPTSGSYNQFGKLVVQGNTFSASTTSVLSLNRGEGAATIASSEELGVIVFGDSAGNEFGTIQCVADATAGAGDYPGRLVFFTTADGASGPTERMRIDSGGNLVLAAASPFYNKWAYDNTTATAANVNIDSFGLYKRSTSSIKYKTNVETLQDQYANAILGCRPVWYQSKCIGDNPDWGHWGFIAEEVAAIDPRLCFFKEEEDGTLEPEGVQYDRFVPHLLNLIKRQGEAIAELQAEVAALKGA